MTKTIKSISILVLIFTLPLHAQVIYETGDQQINNFLYRVEQKGIINLNQSVSPLSKSKITDLLLKIDANHAIMQSSNFTRRGGHSSLTFLEKEELQWYLEKYSLESGKEASILGELNLVEDIFNLRLKPIIGYGVSTTGDKNGHIRKIGAHIDAYLGDNLGIMFEYLDTGEFGDNVDKTKQYTPNTGHWNKYPSNGIEFSDVRAQVNYSWDWGVLSLKKDYNKWGHGKSGKLILSDKVASYPHIQLSFQPTDWLSINYIHGWLNPLIVDSSKSYYYSSGTIEPRLYEEYLTKYIAANYISVMPNDWLTFSLGNSYVYSGDIKPEMLIPVMYYKGLDHNSGRAEKGDGNGIIFFDLGINYPTNYLFYATAIIDVLNIREMLNGVWHKQWIGYKVGASAIDLGIQNSEFRVEYTRTNPWIYENKFELTNYKHLDYSLGHWIGQNADLFTAKFQCSFIRGMHISLMWQLFRKGDMLDIYYAYNDPRPLDFLYGERRTESRVQLSVDYEPYHNVYVQGYWSYSDIIDEKIGRTQDFLLGQKHSFGMSIAYGLAF